MRLVYLYCYWGFGSETADSCLYRVWANDAGKIVRRAWPWSRWFLKPERRHYHGYIEQEMVVKAIRAKVLPSPPTL